MKSIMQEDKNRCFLCGEYPNYNDGPLENHHIFFGKGNRPISEKFGLTVKLHAFKCHRLGPNSVHKNKLVRRALEEAGQRKFEETHTREEFVKAFSENWL